MRTPLGYLWWLVACQRWRVVLGALLGSSWMVGLAVPPYLVSLAIDRGLRPGHLAGLLGWGAALLGIGVLTAVLAILRHRTMTRIRMEASFRSVGTIVEHSVRLGAELPRSVSAGEVVTIGMDDVWAMSRSLTITGPGVGAVVAYLVVAVLLISVSVPLAAVVLVGLPVLVVVVGPLLGRSRQAGSAYRGRQGEVTARLVDIVRGLSVLNGLGGKRSRSDRYRTESHALVREGYAVAAIDSWVQALGVGLPALFLAAVTWLAARMAAQGTITVGELVAVYGYVAMLVVPISFLINGGLDVARGLVAARRVVRFLGLRPAADKGGTPAAGVGCRPATLRDPESGVEVTAGGLTAVAGARPAELVALVDRLGGFGAPAATWDGAALTDLPRAQVRAAILVADNDADLFPGPVREVVGGRFDRDDLAIAAAIWCAAGEDIVAGLPGGLDAWVEPLGRNLSGGQRQRLRLARAVLAEPAVLLAVEPTSAVDVHTEATIAARLRATRAGRATLVTTTSPLLLDHADLVHHLVDGRVAATGTHRELMRTDPAYRALVTRGDGDAQ